MILRQGLPALLLSLEACGGRLQIEDDAWTSDGVAAEDTRIDSTDSTVVDSIDAPADTCSNTWPGDYGCGDCFPPYACAAPLSDDVSYASAPSRAMCAEANGPGTFERWACGCRGFTGIYYGVGTGCYVLHLFDAVTGAHIAKLKRCTGDWWCVEGPPSLPQPVPFCCASDVPFLCGGAGKERCAP